MTTLADLQARYPGAMPGAYGDSETLCERLVALIVAGRKQATCGSLAEYEADGVPIPKAGDFEVVLHWDGTPAAVVQVTEVQVQPYSAVTEDFALAEGEDDSYAGWDSGHRAFFRRNGGWSADMMLVCTRFSLVEVL